MGFFSKKKKKDEADEEDEVSKESKKKKDKKDKKKKKEEEEDVDEEEESNVKEKKKKWWSWGKKKKGDESESEDEDEESKSKEDKKKSEKGKEKEKGKGKDKEKEKEKDKDKAKATPEKEEGKKLFAPHPPATPVKLGASLTSQAPPRTPRTPASTGMADALAHLHSSRSRRGSVPSTPLGRGSNPSSPGLGRGTPLNQVFASLKTPTGRGRGGGLPIASPSSKGTANVIAQALVSSTFKGKGGSLPPTPTTAGRGRGKGILANTIATSFINTVLNSPSVSLAGANLSFSESFTPGRTVFITASKQDEQKARGVVVEPQGDMVVVKPDAPWEHSHRTAPYDKARLRLLPPLRSVVEVKGHSNVKLNGRTGTVVDYDNNANPRPNAIRVALHAHGDQGATTILLNYLNLKKVPGSAPGSLPASPSFTNDPVKKHYQNVSKGRGVVPKEQLVSYLHALPKEDTTLTCVSEVVKKINEHTADTISEGEWAALVSQAQTAARKASIESATSVITQEGDTKEVQGTNEDDTLKSHELSPKLPPADVVNADELKKAEERKQEEQREQEKERAHEEERKREEERRQQEEEKKKQEEEEEEEEKQREEKRKEEERKEEEKKEEQRLRAEEERQKVGLHHAAEMQAKLEAVEETEGAKRSGLEDKEALRRENILDKFKERSVNIDATLRQRDQRDQILLLNRELEELKREKTLTPPPQQPATPVPSVGPFTPNVHTSSPTNNEDLWSAFTTALSEHGASIADINHATDDQLMNLVTENLGFSRLSALRLVNLWHLKVLGSPRRDSATPRQKKTRTADIETPKEVTPVDSNLSTLSSASRPTKMTDEESVKVKGKRVVLDKGAQEFIMVGEVLKHTTTCGQGGFDVRRVVQITPTQNLTTRYNKARSKLSSTPKVLYYSGPSMPGINEVMQSGFSSELRRSKVLQFSTEANIEAAMQSGAGETVMLLLCEVVAGRVHRVPPASTAALYKQVVKHCGASNPPKGVTYQADCIGVDYFYTDAAGESKTATKYILTDHERVIPRYLVYLSVTMPHPAGAAISMPVVLSPRSMPSVATPTHLTYGTPRREMYASPVKVGGLIERGDTLVMCPLHPKQELCLYCMEDEELTCPKCASVGRHAGKRCQPLSELLQRMKGHLAVHEKQVVSQLAAAEAGLGQLERQAGSVREAEVRARRQIRQRTNELMDEVSNRRENLESELTYKAVDAGSRVQEAIKAKAEQATTLREAHAKIHNLITLSTGSEHGVSARASDIIALSKLLERLRQPSGGNPALGVQLNIADDINLELSRMHLPAPSVPGTPYHASPLR